MRILHTCLGNPYNHNGGMHRYCVDLMESQKKNGDVVFVLFPGMNVINSNRIVKDNNNLYRIHNSLPVPITFGVDNPNRYMKKGNKNNYTHFLNIIKPDIVHVHSLMGIHKEFFLACKELQIPIVFTTHDFYPLCFKCNLLDMNNNVCVNGFDPEKCALCNYGSGLNYGKQVILQSRLYGKLRNNKVIQYLKKELRIKKGQPYNCPANLSNEVIKEYRELHNYYKEILNCISVIHCNSSVSMRIYESYYPRLKYIILPITHSGIKKEKHERKSSRLRISYFGGQNPVKGYNQLKKIIEMLPDNELWEISMYGGAFSEKIDNKQVSIKHYFTQEEENYVWDKTDLLLFISQSPETFGFSVLEALARCIPVICSDLAGSCVLLNDIQECVYEHDNIYELLEKITFFLNIDNYKKIQEKIYNLNIDFDIEEHAKKIRKQIYEVALKGNNT